MSDLWFVGDSGRLARHGSLLYRAGPEEVWAVHRAPTTFGTELAQESAELLGTYGALVHGVGRFLLDDGVPLPPELEAWSTAPDVPLDRLGGWVPALGSVEDTPVLLLARRFDHLTVLATTWAGEHLTLVTPSSSPVPILGRGDVDAPPPGWDAHGG